MAFRYGHTADDTLTKDTNRLERFEEKHKETEEHITEVNDVYAACLIIVIKIHNIH